MKKHLFLLIFALFAIGANAQNNDTPTKQDSPNQEVFQIVEQMPEFPGGNTALLEFNGQNVEYPQFSKENGIQGRVFVSFIIEPDGSVSNVKILRGVSEEIDEEAIRVVKSMPNWEPGMSRGKKVRVAYTLPINFKLQGDDEP